MKRFRQPVAADIFLEVQNHAAAHKVVMLAAFSGIHIQLRYARVKIPHFTAHTENRQQVNIESDAALAEAQESKGCRLGDGFPFP